MPTQRRMSPRTGMMSAIRSEADTVLLNLKSNIHTFSDLKKFVDEKFEDVLIYAEIYVLSNLGRSRQPWNTHPNFSPELIKEDFSSLTVGFKSNDYLYFIPYSDEGILVRRDNYERICGVINLLNPHMLDEFTDLTVSLSNLSSRLGMALSESLIIQTQIKTDLTYPRLVDAISSDEASIAILIYLKNISTQINKLTVFTESLHSNFDKQDLEKSINSFKDRAIPLWRIATNHSSMTPN